MQEVTEMEIFQSCLWSEFPRSLTKQLTRQDNILNFDEPIIYYRIVNLRTQMFNNYYSHVVWSNILHRKTYVVYLV